MTLHGLNIIYFDIWKNYLTNFRFTKNVHKEERIDLKSTVNTLCPNRIFISITF